MTPLLLKSFTATSCIGKGVTATLESLRQQRSGLAICDFETVDIDTHIGEVAGVDGTRLPHELRQFDCRNNRLAELGLLQDGFYDAVQRAAQRLGPATHRRISGNQHGRNTADRACLPRTRSAQRRAAGELRVRPHSQLILGRGLHATALRPARDPRWRSPAPARPAPRCSARHAA